MVNERKRGAEQTRRNQGKIKFVSLIIWKILIALVVKSKF